MKQKKKNVLTSTSVHLGARCRAAIIKHFLLYTMCRIFSLPSRRAGESWAELTSQEVANFTMVWGCKYVFPAPCVPGTGQYALPFSSLLSRRFFSNLMEIGLTTLGSRTCISTRRFKRTSLLAPLLRADLMGRFEGW